ncbi:MAG: glycerophosphodiester phosphodiesterase [Gammaproteobacteria bacterium]|nr:glycerophosphodiester phosphodiesterase [Gammaproteobacteria bacterium]
MIPLLVAHRGYMENYPENSLSSIKAALAVGACMVEFDVQMDASGQLLLLHDDNFERTAGIDSDLFNQRDCSHISVHEPKRLGDLFHPEPVPTLTQVLALLAKYPDAKAFVEIKHESLQQWGLERVMDALLVGLKPAQHQCVLIADNLQAIRYARRTSGIRIGWVIHRYDTVHHQQAEKHTPDYMICNYQRIVGDLWQGSWQWMLYDITDPDLALLWADKGAQLIETRDIEAMLQHPQLQRRHCRSRG